MKYFVTALGCGIAGYKVSEIAPLFKGIHHNVIFPESFKPYVEEDAVSQFPTLTQKWFKVSLMMKLFSTLITAVNLLKML